MAWSVAEQIDTPTVATGLLAGDIICSGAPENVGHVVRGDVLEMHIDGLPKLRMKIVRARAVARGSGCGR